MCYKKIRMQQSNRYIITGGGGSGKTTLINALRTKGFNCYDEVSRQIIIEQQQKGGDKMPWLNLPAFAKACFQQMTFQLEEPCNKSTFYDRGIPDLIAYYAVNHLDLDYMYLSKNELYNKTVFICPPWKEIFINDAQRPETFEFTQQIYFELRKCYLLAGFQLITLPKAPVQQRVSFILNHLETAVKNQSCDVLLEQ